MEELQRGDSWHDGLSTRRAAIIRPATPGIIGPPQHPCLWLPARASVPTKSSRSSARAAWERAASRHRRFSIVDWRFDGDVADRCTTRPLRNPSRYRCWRSACGQREERRRRARARGSLQPPRSANARSGRRWGWGPSSKREGGVPARPKKSSTPSPSRKRPMVLNVGTRLGPYEVVALIGAGGMGEGRFAASSIFDCRLAI